MLVYRYIIVLLKEIERMTDAYSLRAPGQTGLHYKVWGTMVGQLLLRSMDRAEELCRSMELRGFHDIRENSILDARRERVLVITCTRRCG